MSPGRFRKDENTRDDRDARETGFSYTEDGKVTNSAIPIPDQVRAKLLSLLPGIRKKKLKGMVCPAGGFTAALFWESLLSDEEIIGFLDNDKAKHGTLIAGLPVNPIPSIATNPPDFVIVASMSFNKEIFSQLLPFSRRHGFKLLDICNAPAPPLLPFVNSRLAPIPSVILKNISKQIPSLISRSSRILLYPNNPLMLNLWLRGVFANLDVVGIIDCDKQLAGTDCHGLRIYSPGQLDRFEADIILAAKPGCHNPIAAELRTLAPGCLLDIVDLCEGMAVDDYRSELAACLGRQIWENRMEGLPVHKVQIGTSNQNICDLLCALSAAREFARRNPELEVQFQYLPEIVDAYDDDLVRPGNGGYIIPNYSEQFLSERDSSIASNYQGGYYLGLALNFAVPPRPELPIMPAVKGLQPRSYIVLATGAEGLTSTLSLEQLNSLVQTAPLPVVCIGNATARPGIKGADYFNGPPLAMLRLIQHASVVLTSRTTPAHIAAAYEVPSVVWIPEDGYDWHIDYPAWNHRRIPVATHGFIDRVREALESLTGSNQGPTFAHAVQPYKIQSHGLNQASCFPAGPIRKTRE
jgi:hypothetical protein